MEPKKNLTTRLSAGAAPSRKKEADSPDSTSPDRQAPEEQLPESGPAMPLRPDKAGPSEGEGIASRKGGANRDEFIGRDGPAAPDGSGSERAKSFKTKGSPDPRQSSGAQAAASEMIGLLGQEIQNRFVSEGMRLSFEEYLDLFVASPRQHSRSAAQYLRDAMLYFGVETRRTPAAKLTRFKIFDCEFDGGNGRVSGHEEAQTALFRHLSNFVQAGRVNKLILLHGPNGSAKSSLVSALMRGVEHYSRQPEGARYRFNWIFPVDEVVKEGIGFGSAKSGQPDSMGTSFAHLDGDLVAAKISCELKDPPLFLIPPKQRQALLDELLESRAASEIEGTNADNAASASALSSTAKSTPNPTSTSTSPSTSTSTSPSTSNSTSNSTSPPTSTATVTARAMEAATPRSASSTTSSAETAATAESAATPRKIPQKLYERATVPSASATENRAQKPSFSQIHRHEKDNSSLELSSDQPEEASFTLSDYMREGELCAKCRSIYQALLSHYGGDYLKVLRHVQVERFHVSRRYLEAAATVEPQLSVDADFRPLSLDRSAASLPPALQNLTLYESAGALVSGNRGLVEFSDLLKRPMEAWKYLLGTSETATVPLMPFMLQLDTVLIASTNEKHLDAFKELPDFSSFKGRIELVRVPYLRRVSDEKKIYDDALSRSHPRPHIAPHATWVAAMWAVLTRLKKVQADRWRGELRALVENLGPMDKLLLYDEGRAPENLSLQQGSALRGALEALYRESDSWPNYEGKTGASARELKTILGNAAQNPNFRCLTPQAVLLELEQLVKDSSVYEFLKQTPEDGYHDHAAFVDLSKERLLDLLDEEIRDSMGLVSERQYRELFERYVQHVSAWLKNGRIQNRLTGEYRRPDENMLKQTEFIVMNRGQDPLEFRRSLISSVGAYRLDNPESDIDYSQIFPDLFRKLRDHYYDDRKDTLRRNKENILAWMSGDGHSLLERERRQVSETLDNMCSKFGYCQHCAQDSILFLMQERYSD